MTIKAIETAYKGWRFRSRLEARWAVFFDALGWAFKYEHQGFEIGWDGQTRRWLPDFEVTTGAGQMFYVEVKGETDFFANGKFLDLLDFHGGPPGFQNSADRHAAYDDWRAQKAGCNGLMILGDIPEPKNNLFIPVACHAEGIWVNWMQVAKSGAYKNPQLYGAFTGRDGGGLDGSLADFQPVSFSTPFGFPGVYEALFAARSARFEHGARP